MQLVEFGSICELQNGRAFKPEEWSEVGTPIIRIQNLNDESKSFNYCDFEVESRFHVRSGDLLFSWSGTPGTSFGAFFWNRGKGFLNQHIFRVDIDDSKVDKFYLRYAINSKLNLIIEQAHGGVGLKHITKGKLEAIQIPLPSLSEQKRIAAILDKADAIRRKRQQAIKLADDFLRSVFLEMFGDPVTNPKGWEVKSLISLCTEGFQNGAYFPPENYADDGVEMVHMSDAFYDTVQRGALRRVRCSSEDIKKYGLNENQLLISRRSLTYEGAAKPSLIPKSDEPLIFESSLIRVSPSNDKILTRFLFQYLSTESVKEHHIRKYVTGATIKGISQKNLEKISVYVPPIGLQEEFSLVVSKVGRLIQNGMASSIVDSRLFQSLSQKAFSGTL